MINTAMTALKSGAICLNGWNLLPDPLAAEMMASAGFHSLTIDLQHGLHDFRSVSLALQTLFGRQVTPFVRVHWNDAGTIGKVLDAGALGIICPMINTAADARKLVEACLYAPDGARSYGPVRAGFYGGPSLYHSQANASITILPQIETAEAVRNMEAILDVPGVSGLYVGPSDLGLSMGLPPVLDRDEPEMIEIYQRVVDLCRDRGKIAGIHNLSAEYALRMAQMGFQFLTIATDATLLVFGAGRAVGLFHAANAAPG